MQPMGQQHSFTKQCRPMPLFLVALVVISGAMLGTAPHAVDQSARQSSDVNTPAMWSDQSVRLVLPATGDRPSRIEQVRAKVIVVQLPLTSPDRQRSRLSLAAVSDPHQGATYVLPGGAFYVSDQAGMIAMQLSIATLHVLPSFVTVPKPNREADAIEQLATGLTAEGMLAQVENHNRVNIGDGVPLKFVTFFSKGSQLVDAEITAAELRDRVLRIDLRSHEGVPASIWFDVASRKVTKKQFGR